MSSANPICEYVARQNDPSNWHGDEPSDWQLDTDEWSCPHSAIEDTDRCVFHTSPDQVPTWIDESEELVRAVNEDGPHGAEELAGRLKEFVGADFGPINLSYVTLDAGDHRSILLSHSTFHGEVTIEHSDIAHPIEMDACRLNGRLNLWSTHILEDLSCRQSILHGVHFSRAEVNGTASFTGSIFNPPPRSDDEIHRSRLRDTEIGATYRGGCIFNKCTFTTDVRFSHSVFERYCQFKGATFKRNIEYLQSSFDKPRRKTVDDGLNEAAWSFAWVGVGGRTRFNGCVFRGGVTFHDANFAVDDGSEDRGELGSVTFKDVRFIDEVSFRRVTFPESIFERTRFEWDTIFSESSFIEDARFDGPWAEENRESVFIGKVNFFDTTFAGFASFKDVPFHDTAKFSRISFEGVTFANAEFHRGAKFSHTELGQVSFNGAVLKGATFEGAHLDGTDLEGADLRGASFANARLVDTNFRYADLSEADLKGAILHSTDLNNINLTNGTLLGATFDNVRLTDANLTGANLKDVNLNGEALDDTTLTDANLDGARLIGSDFRRAVFARTQLAGANLTGANLDGARFRDALIDRSTNFGHLDNNDKFVRGFRVVHDPESVPQGYFDRVQASLKRYLFPSSIWRDDRLFPDGGTVAGSHPDDMHRAARIYQSIESIAGDNVMPRLHGKAFLRRQEMKRQRYAAEGQWGAYVRSSLARLTMAHGESPWRVIGVGLFVVVFFGLLYPIGGIVSEGWLVPVGDGATFGDPITYGTGEIYRAVADGLYFSSVTFSTLGFGDFSPVQSGRLLAMINTGLGALLIALLVWVLGRRSAR